MPSACVAGVAARTVSEAKGNSFSSSTSAFEKSSSCGFNSSKVSRLRLAALRNVLRPWPEQVRRQDVELRRLVDRLDRVAAEQLVAPRDEVVDVLHHDGLLVRDEPEAGDRDAG